MWVRRDTDLEASLVEKYAALSGLLDERARRLWAATESRATGYGGDAVVSAATGLLESSLAFTRSPAAVLVCPISSTTASKVRSGFPRQFCVMWQKTRCSTLFRLLRPWVLVFGVLRHDDHPTNFRSRQAAHVNADGGQPLRERQRLVEGRSDDDGAGRCSPISSNWCDVATSTAMAV